MTKAERARQEKLIEAVKGLSIYFSAMCNEARDSGSTYRAARAHERAYAAGQFLDMLTNDDYLDHIHGLYKEFVVHYDAEHFDDTN